MCKDSNATEVQVVPQVESYDLTPAGQTAKQFEIIQRKAKALTSSTIVPETYRNNIGNCIIAIEMAERMGTPPLMVMQNLYIVHGNPAWSSKYLIGSINASKRFSPLRYEFRGEEGTPQYGCRCFAYEANDRERKEPLYGDWITMDMANKEGWTKKSGSKWLTMPNQMLRYRAAAFWQRVYCPEISMGLLTAEEAEDIAIDTTSAQAEAARAKAEQMRQRAEEAMARQTRADAVEDAEVVVDAETGEIAMNI
jgi:hypothetical protein